MKKIISVLMAITLFAMSATLISSASEKAIIVITTTDAEYTVEFESTTLSEEQRQSIANNLVFGKDDCIQTYGLSCILFGHNTEENKVSVITHKVRSSSPRCKRDTYVVTTCTKCDYQDQEHSGTSYIACCPTE